MPVYEAVVDGKPRKIEVTKASENAFAVKIDDKPVKVELSNSKVDLQKPFTIKIGDKSYQVELPTVEQGKAAQVKIEDVTFKAEVRIPARKQAVTTFEPVVSAVSAKRTSSTRQQPVAEGAITAPMTGKIVSVRVKQGDQVKQNQVLCIIEAMKMENEITAPKAGTVHEVLVSDGSAVSEGDTLLIID